MDIIRPSINENNETITSDGVIISRCTMLENGDIKGITSDGVKALFKLDSNKWYFGSEISRLNLVSLADRTKEERQRFGSIGGKKAKENRDNKKNIQELAKIMLDQTMDKDRISSILGDKADLLPDDSVASVLIGAMVKQALEGSFKAFEAVRDTAGYKPKNEVEIQADIMTESDRMLIDKVAKTG